MASAYDRPFTPGVTAFIGATKVGIRYPERVLDIECSVKLDVRDLDIPLEEHEDHSQTCAACNQAI